MNVAIFSGSTGGHLFPALSFAHDLKKKHPSSRINYFVSERITPFLRYRLLSEGHPVHFLAPFPLASRSPFQMVRSVINLARALVRIRKSLDEISPDLVVGFGSYVSWPGLLLASSRGIPTLAHEQNVELGKANRSLVKRVDRIAVSFSRTLAGLPAGKGFLVGMPVRPEILESVISKPPLDDRGKWCVLILGGSQGSRPLNQAAVRLIQSLTPEEKRELAVIHITGAQDFGWVRSAYQSFGVSAQVYDYCADMASCYQASDVVISRAGAGVLTEIAYFGLPGILIPFPYARSHQQSNALHFVEKGGAVVIEEKALYREKLKDELFSLLTDRERRAEMSRRVKELSRPDAGERMVEIAESLVSQADGFVEEMNVAASPS